MKYTWITEHSNAKVGSLKRLLSIGQIISVLKCGDVKQA